MSVIEGSSHLANAQGDAAAASRRGEWNWTPALPIQHSPLFTPPFSAKKIAGYFVANWFSLCERLVFLALALIAWRWFMPPLESYSVLTLENLSAVYLRNLVLMILVAGGLHLYFFTLKAQGEERKFDPRPLDRDNPRFDFNNQVHDNLLWTLASGVTIWSAYELLFWWGYARDFFPLITWRGNELYFTLLFVAIPIWNAFHFHWVHKLLHWRPLYQRIHSLHHRNINVGPWSGMSMHPIEHLLYLSSVLIHAVAPSHPLHILFHLFYLSLGGVTSHAGFEALMIKGRRICAIGSFFHTLHHRHFECNYGNSEFPCDRWRGTFHDGSQEASKAIRQRRIKMHGSKTGGA